MKRLFLSTLVLGGLAALAGASPPGGKPAAFENPVRLMAGDTAIRVEAPGYACPCWADLKGDGKMQLLVGQFAKGKIRVFKHLDGAKFEPGEWLQADGKVAEVPGVW
jgi:hypothetical protein